MNNIEERRLVNDAAISDLTEEERNNPTEAILTNFLNKDWPKLEQFLRDNLGGMSHIIFNVNAGFDKKEKRGEESGALPVRRYRQGEPQRPVLRNDGLP